MIASKRFRRAYLHVGFGKTGTSSIQHALLAQADTLERDYDIHYPRGLDDPRPFEGNHTLLLGTLFKSQPELMRANIVAKIDTPERVADFNKRLRESLDEGFHTCDASTLLLSGEGVSDFDLDTNRRLLGWLGSVADEVRIIACLRHPVNLLASAIQQKLKTDWTLPALYEKPPIRKFATILGQLEALVGRDAIDIYDFEDARENDSGVVGAFLQRLGVPGQALSVADGHNAVNASMSQEAAELLSALNSQRKSIVAGRRNPDRTSGDVGLFMAIPGRKFRVPAWVYANLEARVAADLEWLEAHFQVVLRVVAPPVLEQSQSYSNESLKHIALIMSELYNQRH